ncbi:Melanopsin [Acropora cervicornis]|uniref:Melanopsin n=1 Tax=Acropora cervicornis TaxID=6130 RepID=A0AAD9UYU1_ACRCE|nr:Melanopsin [Acropora cervicornis]
MPGFQNKSEEPQPTEGISSQDRFIVASFYALLAVTALGLNTPVLITFMKDRKLRVLSNRIILSITIGDWLHAFLAYPVAVFANASHDSQGLTGVVCSWYGFITVFLSFGIMLHHATFAVERAIVIQYATTSLTNAKTINFMVVSLWAFALLWSSLPLLGWSAYVPHVVLCSLDWQSRDLHDVVFVYCIFFVFFLAPIVVMVTSYYKIFQTVKKMTQNARDLWGEKAAPTREAFESQKKTARMACVMSYCFLFAWTPYAAVSLYVFLWKPQSMAPSISIVPALFAKTSACFNPVIYFLLFRKFRESLKRTMCGFFMDPKTATNENNKNKRHVLKNTESKCACVQINNLSPRDPCNLHQRSDCRSVGNSKSHITVD